MIVEPVAKIRLFDGEEECLHKALDIIRNLYSETAELSCKMEFENKFDEILDEMHSIIEEIL